MGDLGTPQGGRDELEGMCPESMGSQAMKPKSEIHWTPKASGNQAPQLWGGTAPGWGARLWGFRPLGAPCPMPYSAE